MKAINQIECLVPSIKICSELKRVIVDPIISQFAFYQNELILVTDKQWLFNKDVYPAPTSSELANAILDITKSNVGLPWFNTEVGFWVYSYRGHYVESTTEAEARARLLLSIHLYKTMQPYEQQ